MKKDLIFVYLRILNIIWQKFGKLLGYEVFLRIYERARRDLIEEKPWILNLNLTNSGFCFKEINEEEIDEEFSATMEKLIDKMFTILSNLIGEELVKKIQDEVKTSMKKEI